MSRKALAWVVAAPVAAAVIALMLDGPDRQAVQPIGRAQGDASVEIELHDPWVNDAVTRAWAVDPVTTVGNAIAHNDEQRTQVFLEVGGYDAVVVYSLFPSCGIAPEIRARRWDDRVAVDLKSIGGCDGEMRHVRAIGLELAHGLDATLLTASHQDP